MVQSFCCVVGVMGTSKSSIASACRAAHQLQRVIVGFNPRLSLLDDFSTLRAHDRNCGSASPQRS